MNKYNNINQVSSEIIINPQKMNIINLPNENIYIDYIDLTKEQSYLKSKEGRFYKLS